MRKTKIIKIDIDEKTKKDFKVNELTVREIIDLSQISPLFGADARSNEEKAGNNTKNQPDGQKTEEPKGLLSILSGNMADFTEMAKTVMDKSCDFKLEELVDLAPSDIELVFEGWQEVNQSFLGWLKKVGILEAVLNIIRGAMLDFSETLAI